MTAPVGFYLQSLSGASIFQVLRVPEAQKFEDLASFSRPFHVSGCAHGHLRDSMGDRGDVLGFPAAAPVSMYMYMASVLGHTSRTES